MASEQLETLNPTLLPESEPEDECLGWDKEEEHAPPLARNEGDKLERKLDDLMICMP